MLCERGIEGTIMVYDKELKYVRCVERMGPFQDVCVCADSHTVTSTSLTTRMVASPR